MTTTIRLRVRKDIDSTTARKILKLQGSLIAKSFTDIVHFKDDGEKFYIYHFTTPSETKHFAIEHVTKFIMQESLENNITLL